tara:strand:+ start:453 stop:971 length:519 start_codon:yes stop_codon:yes gene_type:complete
MLSNSSSRKTKALELRHEQQEADRTERRRVYAEFIGCMDQWRELAGSVGLLHCEFEPPPNTEPDKSGSFLLLVDDIPASHPKRSAAVLLEKEHDELWERWRRCLGTLQLIGSSEVSTMADQLFKNYNRRMAEAWEGELIPAFEEDLPIDKELVGVMRFDLQLEDGYSITEEY